MRHYLVLGLVILVVLLAGCGSPSGNDGQQTTPTPLQEGTPTDTPDETPTPEPGATPTSAPGETQTSDEETPTSTAEPEETPTPTPEPEETPTPTPEPNATPAPGPDDGESPGADRQVDDCTTIDEPGEYALTTDLEDREEAVCIEITASDVVLEGNDHLVEGTGDEDSVGVHVTGPEQGSEAVNVTVRNLQVERWGDGVLTGTGDLQPGEVTLENVVASDNAQNGVLLRWGGSPSLENVTAEDNGAVGVFSFEGTVDEMTEIRANDNGASGITLWEESGVTATDVEASGNGDHGLDLWDNVDESEFDDVTATGNGRAGINTGIDVRENTFSSLYVADNQGPGVAVGDSGANTFQEAIVENNTGTGVLVEFSDDQQLTEVTVRRNAGGQVDASTGGSVSGTTLGIGDNATFDFAEQQVTLDAVPEDELPELPDDGEAVGSGVVVDGIQGSMTVILRYDEERVEGDTVELWRHAEDEWTTEESYDAGEAGGTVTTDLTDDGVYAPVEPQD